MRKHICRRALAHPHMHRPRVCQHRAAHWHQTHAHVQRSPSKCERAHAHAGAEMHPHASTCMYVCMRAPVVAHLHAHSLCGDIPRRTDKSPRQSYIDRLANIHVHMPTRSCTHISAEACARTCKDVPCMYALCLQTSRRAPPLVLGTHAPIMLHTWTCSHRHSGANASLHEHACAHAMTEACMHTLCLGTSCEALANHRATHAQIILQTLICTSRRGPACAPVQKHVCTHAETHTACAHFAFRPRAKHWQQNVAHMHRSSCKHARAHEMRSGTFTPGQACVYASACRRTKACGTRLPSNMN